MKKTALGIFANWLTIQIPRYVDNRVSKAFDKLPKTKTGAKGKDGVSVVDAEIAADDHLVMKLSDGNIIDAGELPGVSETKIQHIIATSMQNPQITVSATPPENPYYGQLWYDIS